MLYCMDCVRAVLMARIGEGGWERDKDRDREKQNRDREEEIEEREEKERGKKIEGSPLA